MAARTWSCTTEMSRKFRRNKKRQTSACDWCAVKTHRHELLQLVQSVEISPSLQEMAGGHEVAAAPLQARVHLLQQALQRPQAAALQAGLQHALQEHLLRALLRHPVEEAGKETAMRSSRERR